MNSDKKLSYRTFPLVWPWKGINNQNISAKEALLSRKFTIIYMVVIWGIVLTLDFPSSRNCTGTWQLALQCKYMFWVSNLTEAPLVFFRNLFTTPLLHNGIEAIILVTVAGGLITIQSYEALFGTREVTSMFFLAYILVGSFFGVFYSVGFSIWPESGFFQFSLERGWMGGSLGFFYLYGALACVSRRPLIFLSIPVGLEAINFFILGISPHISLMHIGSLVPGYFVKRYMLNRNVMKEPNEVSS